jgi:hypothetical protein
MWPVSMPPSSAWSQLHSSQRHLCKLELGRGRLFLGRAHVCPDDSREFDRRISDQANPVCEFVPLGLVGHVDALARHVVFPAVIDATEAIFLIAREEE